MSYSQTPLCPDPTARLPYICCGERLLCICAAMLGYAKFAKIISLKGATLWN